MLSTRLQPQSATTRAAPHRKSRALHRRGSAGQPAVWRRPRWRSQLSTCPLGRYPARRDQCPALQGGRKAVQSQRAPDRGHPDERNYSSSSPQSGFGSSKPARWHEKHGIACSGCRQSQSSGRGCSTRGLTASGSCTLMCRRPTHPRSRAWDARATISAVKSPDERGVCLLNSTGSINIIFLGTQ